MKIGALFGGWQASTQRKVIGGVLVATTSLGCINPPRSTLMIARRRGSAWGRNCRHSALRFSIASDPEALQVGIVGSGVDSEVWLRRPSAGDDWVRILTTDGR